MTVVTAKVIGDISKSSLNAWFDGKTNSLFSWTQPQGLHPNRNGLEEILKEEKNETSALCSSQQRSDKQSNPHKSTIEVSPRQPEGKHPRKARGPFVEAKELGAVVDILQQMIKTELEIPSACHK